MSEKVFVVAVEKGVDFLVHGGGPCDAGLGDLYSRCLASGKSGVGVEEILEAVVERLPEPRWTEHAQPRALIFDSQYDSYKGVICYIRVFSGVIKKNAGIQMMSDSRRSEVKEIGRFCPQLLGHNLYV